MRLTYKPDGREPQQFEFSPEKILSSEAEAIEDVGGESWDSYLEFGDKLVKGNIRAMHALLWVMLCRTDPSLEFSDVVFRLDEFFFDGDDEDEPVGKDEHGDSDTDSQSPRPALVL